MAGCWTGEEPSARWCSGCALAAVGFALWAGKVTQLSFGTQQWYIILAGAGMGLMLGPASTDAVNRASRLSYGEATGITQTVRNYAASLGLAILGTVLVSQMRSHVTSSLVSQGVPAGKAASEARPSPRPRAGTGVSQSIPHFVRLDFAYATRSVLIGMAVAMAAAAVVGLIGLRPGVQEDPEASAATPASRAKPIAAWSLRIRRRPGAAHRPFPEDRRPLAWWW